MLLLFVVYILPISIAALLLEQASAAHRALSGLVSFRQRRQTDAWHDVTVPLEPKEAGPPCRRR